MGCDTRNCVYLCDWLAWILLNKRSSLTMPGFKAWTLSAMPLYYVCLSAYTYLFVSTRRWVIICYKRIYIFPTAQQPTPSPVSLVGKVSKLHLSQTSHSVRILWSSYQPEAETTHNIYKRESSMAPVGFEPAIPARERQQTFASDRAATGIGVASEYILRKWRNLYRHYFIQNIVAFLTALIAWCSIRCWQRRASAKILTLQRDIYLSQ